MSEYRKFVSRNVFKIEANEIFTPVTEEDVLTPREISVFDFMSDKARIAGLTSEISIYPIEQIRDLSAVKIVARDIADIELVRSLIGKLHGGVVGDLIRYLQYPENRSIDRNLEEKVSLLIQEEKNNQKGRGRLDGLRRLLRGFPLPTSKERIAEPRYDIKHYADAIRNGVIECPSLLESAVLVTNHLTPLKSGILPLDSICEIEQKGGNDVITLQVNGTTIKVDTDTKPVMNYSYANRPMGYFRFITIHPEVGFDRKDVLSLSYFRSLNSSVWSLGDNAGFVKIHEGHSALINQAEVLEIERTVTKEYTNKLLMFGFDRIATGSIQKNLTSSMFPIKRE